MPTSNQIIRTAVIMGIMLIAAFTRLIPHPANLTAIMAVALFGGAKFRKSPFAILVPLMIMLITDLFIGFYSLMPIVYGCIALTTVIGTYVGKKSNPLFVIGGSVLASTIFFLVTNATVWYHDPNYSQNANGLLMCYNAGIPFYRNQLFGDLFFNFVLFGSYKLAKSKYPALAY
jgi:hypothetical protein